MAIRMINIMLKDGKQYKFVASESVELVHGRGSYGNGSIDWIKEQILLAEIAKQISQKNALAAEVDGKLLPLDACITSNCVVDFITTADQQGQEMIQRTGIFFLAYGFSLLPKKLQRLGGGIEQNKIYYDFVLLDDEVLTDNDLKLVEKIILQLLDEPQTIRLCKLPYFQIVKRLADLSEFYMIRYIDEHDDGGPVEMNVSGDFYELSQGLLLHDVSIIKMVKLLGLKKTEIGYRVYAEVWLEAFEKH